MLYALVGIGSFIVGSVFGIVFAFVGMNMLIRKDMDRYVKKHDDDEKP